jgi:heme/copper-type cytochrome/quinol oxidase subunit 2
MQNDTISYDTLNSRPLPKWLVDQKTGLTTIQPQKIVMKEDHSLKISFILTSTFILIAVAVLTVFFLKKYKNRL